MPEKPERKNQPELSSSVTPFLVVGNDRLAPYIQVFSHQPENIVQHSLGCLFGIFKIDDTNVDSAFIVNFLVSEIKKEYYGNPRRTPAGSFEAGLNRINIALSELAKQGNISWMGKLESAVCALEKNGMLHFSVTGLSHIALLREGSLSLISEGLASETDTPNPLKTFTEISSGKLHPEDMIVLGSRELFEFLPQEKMERSARHFSYEEFTRFLHTALVNEFDFCAAITAILHKKTSKKIVKKTIPSVSPEAVPNLWGANSFQKHHRSTSKETERFSENIEEASDQAMPESRRDGHIYIQQQHSDTDVSQKKFQESFLILREHLANIMDERREALQTTLRQWHRTLAKKIHSASDTPAENTLSEIQAPDIPAPTTPSSSKISPLTEEAPKETEETPLVSEKPPLAKIQKNRKKRILHEVRSQEKPFSKSKSEKQPFLSKIDTPNASVRTSTPKSVAEKLQPFMAPISKQLETKKPVPVSNAEQRIPTQISTILLLKTIFSNIKTFAKRLQLGKNAQTLGKRFLPKLRNGFILLVRFLSFCWSKTVPLTREITVRFQSAPLRWRFGIGAILLCVILFPFFVFPLIKKTSPQSEKPKSLETVPSESKQHSETVPETPPKNETLYTSQNIILKIFSPDDNILLVAEKNSVVMIFEKEAPQIFTLPAESGSCIDATYMSDLSLLFLLTDKGALVSFSPVSKKFSSNNLVIGNASYGKTFIGSYLTYLYVANTAENSIIRYPRAEGGFGTPTPWILPDSGISLAGVTHLFVNESVYLTKQNSIIRLSNKKTDPWTLDTPSSGSTFNSVFVSKNAETVLVTDTGKNKLLLFSKTGDPQKEIPLPANTSKFVNAIMTDKGIVYAQTDHEVQVLP